MSLKVWFLIVIPLRPKVTGGRQFILSRKATDTLQLNHQCKYMRCTRRMGLRSFISGRAVRAAKFLVMEGRQSHRMNNRPRASFLLNRGFEFHTRTECTPARFIVFETNSRCQDEEWALTRSAHHNGAAASFLFISTQPRERARERVTHERCGNLSCITLLIAARGQVCGLGCRPKYHHLPFSNLIFLAAAERTGRELIW